MSIYFYYFLMYLKSRAIYKTDFIVGILSNIMVGGMGLLFVSFLVDGDKINSLGGWSKEEVLFIYGYSLLSLSIFNTVAFNLYRFGDKYVNGGQFDRVLLRPIGSIQQVLFESFNLDSFGTLILGIYVLIKSASKLNIQFNLLDILWLVLSSISGASILISVFLCLATIAFYFDDKLGIGAPVYSLINFGRYPINIFNNFIQFFLSFIIPFAFVAFYPATHFFEQKGYQIYCYSTPLVALICYKLTNIFWKTGSKRYSSTGF